jgi:hypothetical protein
VAERVDLIKASRPLRFIILPFHIGNLSAALSTKGCQADLGSFPKERGNPKYLAETAQPGKERIPWKAGHDHHRT